MGCVDRVVALQPRQLDDLLHQPGQPLGLGDHPAGEPLHRLGVVGRVVHGLGEQPDRADRRLQLVADVGDEVAADRLDLPLAGAVLDQREHQPASSAARPGRSRAAARGRGGSSPARSRGCRRRGVPGRRAAASSPDTSALPRTNPMAYAGALALSTTSSSPTTTALLRSTERTVAIPGGSSGSSTGSCRRCCRSLSTHAKTAPPATPAPRSAARNAWVVGSTRSAYAGIHLRLTPLDGPPRSVHPSFTHPPRRVTWPV